MYVMHIMNCLFCFRMGFGSLRQSFHALPMLCIRLSRTVMMQSGAHRLLLVALLLLALPDVLTFHVLFALPRFADRNRQFCAYSLHPISSAKFGLIPLLVFVSPSPDKFSCPYDLS